MAATSSTVNPIASFYEAQTAATAEIAQAALNGMQRLQRITLQAMRAGAGGQFSLAQSMGAMRDGSDVGRAMTSGAAPAAEQGARYQKELLQAIAEMNNDIARASYSMMERMRDALGAATQGSLTMTPNLPGASDPMAMVDSAMRQWQTAVQQMTNMAPPSMRAMAFDADTEGYAAAAPARTSKRSTKRSSKRKSSGRKRA